MLKENFNYPFIQNKDKFNNYYLDEVKNLIRSGNNDYLNAIDNYKMNTENSIPFFPYELNLTTNITLNKNNLISLYQDTYSYTGGAHGNTEREGSTWNIYKQKKLKLSDLLNSNYQKILLDNIKKIANHLQDTQQVSYFDELNTNLEKFYDENNFYLDDKGINIFYPLYTIAPYVNGISVFNIPYKIFQKNA